MKVGDLIRCSNDNDIGVVTGTRKRFSPGGMVEQALITWTLDPSYYRWLDADSGWLEVISESR